MAVSLCAATTVLGADARAATSAGGTSGTPTFSHMVVVDQQRPGFEPDVKVDSHGVIYSSVPNGFSTTASYLWSSSDHGKSYQLVPANVPPTGKPITCAGGGDSDLFLDNSNNLYFSDLQGLTNISQSVSSDGGKTFSTNCAGVPNTPVDRMWFAGTGSLAGAAGKALKLYEDYDVVAGNAGSGGGNALVETVSNNGTTFTPVLTSTPAASCAGTAAANCVTGDEGISGNQVVDPGTGNLFIAHTDSTSAKVLVSEGKVAAGAVPGTTSATWSESPVLDGPLCPDASCVSPAGHPEAIAGENFGVIARDSAGYLYNAFTFAPIDAAGIQTAPEAIYVVHSTQPATGPDPSKLTWSAPTKVSGAGTNIFPWVAAGSNGRVDVAWYHTDETQEAGKYGASGLNNAEWTVQLGQDLAAHSEGTSYADTTVTEHPIKHGQICTNGLGCATGGDRSLGDYLQVSVDQGGRAILSYVDDTSNAFQAGEATGPDTISRQIGGPSLLASVGTVTGPGAGPGVPIDRVPDASEDAFYSANGSRSFASENLDLTGASLIDGPNNTLTATITTESLANLSSNVTGNPDASWIIRWTQVDPTQPGNGHIYYAGMESDNGGSPRYFDGDASCLNAATGTGGADHCKYLAYPGDQALSGSQAGYDAKTGVITLHIPGADIGNPTAGTTLYSVTAFTDVSASPQTAPGTLFNLTDASPPFDHTVAGGPSPTVPEVPWTALVPLTGLGAAGAVLLFRRRRRARA